MSVLVPFEDHLLREDVSCREKLKFCESQFRFSVMIYLTLVEKEDDLVEGLQKVHVVVTVLLDLVEERQLGAGVAREGGEQRDMFLKVTKGLEGRRQTYDNSHTLCC